MNEKLFSGPGSLQVIAESPPTLPDDVVAGHLAHDYGLAGALQPLVSERDQNFRLRVDGGDSFVVKIANRAERRAVTESQAAVLDHLARQDCPVAVPVPIPSRRDGALLTTIDYAGTSYNLRVVSWLDGQPAEHIACTVDFAASLGRSLAHIDVAMARIECSGGEGQPLLWDMQQAGDLRALLHHIDNGEVRRRVESSLDDFQSNAMPAFSALRTQMIHNDLNPGNVLVAIDDPTTVTGVIDFGDMVQAPLVIDVAVALSYLRRFDGDPLELPSSFVAGYSAVRPLEDREVALLYDLVRIRLATTIAILHWRAAARAGDDPYLEKSLAERGAERFLGIVDATARDRYLSRMLAAAAS